MLHMKESIISFTIAIALQKISATFRILAQWNFSFSCHAMNIT